MGCVRIYLHSISSTIFTKLADVQLEPLLFEISGQNTKGAEILTQGKVEIKYS